MYKRAPHQHDTTTTTRQRQSTKTTAGDRRRTSLTRRSLREDDERVTVTLGDSAVEGTREGTANITIKMIAFKRDAFAASSTVQYFVGLNVTDATICRAHNKITHVILNT